MPHFEKNVVVGKSITLKQLQDDGFNAIFICSGAGLPKMMNIEGVEAVETNLKSATLRISLDISDDASSDTAASICDKAYSLVDSICPVSTYFTNTEEGKMYDLEIAAYTYLVDDAHPVEGQVYVQLTKTGAGNKVVDNMNSAKNQDLVNQIKRY